MTTYYRASYYKDIIYRAILCFALKISARNKLHFYLVHNCSKLVKIFSASQDAACLLYMNRQKIRAMYSPLSVK